MSATIDSDGDGIPDCNEYLNGLDYENILDAIIDSDGDSLTNIEEFQLGLNYTNTDSDYDGLADNDEIQLYNTNPRNADTDGDGLTDAYEITNGFNPLDNGERYLDSDGDGFSNRMEVYAGTDVLNLGSSPTPGAILWSFSAQSNVSATPALGSDGAIYFPSNDGKLYSINDDGTLRWSVDTGEGASTFHSAMLGSDDITYLGSSAFDSNGVIQWQFNPGEGFFGKSAALGNDGAIYVGFSRTGTSFLSTFYKLNSDGTVNWGIDNLKTDSPPAVAKNGIIYVVGTNGLNSINPNDGSINWSFALGQSVSRPVIRNDGSVIVT